MAMIGKSLSALQCVLRTKQLQGFGLKKYNFHCRCSWRIWHQWENWGLWQPNTTTCGLYIRKSTYCPCPSSGAVVSLNYSFFLSFSSTMEIWCELNIAFEPFCRWDHTFMQQTKNWKLHWCMLQKIITYPLLNIWWNVKPISSKG